MELVYEAQRAAFKEQPAHKGKLYTSGLASIVRHPNWLGYSLWHAGAALVAVRSPSPVLS